MNDITKEILSLLAALLLIAALSMARVMCDHEAPGVLVQEVEDVVSY
jgi:hypothetical protein